MKEKLKNFLEEKEEFFPVLWLTLTFLVFFIAFFPRLGLIFVDIGREALVPERILNGEKVFEDIFLLFSPLSYYFNALMYKFFGVHLDTLRYVGGFLSYFIILAVYYISREFLDKRNSFLLALFVTSSTVFACTVFNFVLPYSFAIVWALMAVLWSIFFLLKYVKNGQNIDAILTFFFFGLSVAMKYEYIPFGLVLLYAFLYSRPLSFKNLLKCGAYFLIFPLLTVFIMLYQKISFDSLIYVVEIIKNMANSETLHYFYTNYAGTYFQKSQLEPNFLDFLLFFAIFFGITILTFFAYKIPKKVLKNIAMAAILILTYVVHLFNWWTMHLVFSFLPIFIFLILIYNFIKYKEDKTYLILLLSAFVLSLKSFFFLKINFYGAYALVLLIVALFVTLDRYFKEKGHEKVIKTSISFLLIAFSILFTQINYRNLVYLKNDFLETARGKIYLQDGYTKVCQSLGEFINKIVKDDEKILIMPEGQLYNFLYNKKATYLDNWNLHYFESFGEKNIIDLIKKDDVDYIVVTNRNMNELGGDKANIICEDYGFEFCTWLRENFAPYAVIKGKLECLIYKKRDIE